MPCSLKTYSTKKLLYIFFVSFQLMRHPLTIVTAASSFFFQQNPNGSFTLVPQPYLSNDINYYTPAMVPSSLISAYITPPAASYGGGDIVAPSFNINLGKNLLLMDPNIRHDPDGG